jgi:macrodomain Ter protein organizer (MatP/YcbG family)
MCPFSPRSHKRWEHEHVVEAAQTRLDQNPQAMRVRRETVEHPFATLKMRMGATHFLMKRLPNVATEMALIVSTRIVAPKFTSAHKRIYEGTTFCSTSWSGV